MMKSLLKYLIIGLLIPMSSNAQRLSPEQKEKYEALKVAFLTEELSLSAKEAQSFWPVFNEMEGKLSEVRDNKRENIRNARKNFENLTDAELEASIKLELDLAEQEVAIKRDYLSKFQAVLPIKKVAKLYASEEKFKRRLLQKMKEKHRR